MDHEDIEDFRDHVQALLAGLMRTDKQGRHKALDQQSPMMRTSLFIVACENGQIEEAEMISTYANDHKLLHEGIKLAVLSDHPRTQHLVDYFLSTSAGDMNIGELIQAAVFSRDVNKISLLHHYCTADDVELLLKHKEIHSRDFFVEIAHLEQLETALRDRNAISQEVDNLGGMRMGRKM